LRKIEELIEEFVNENMVLIYIAFSFIVLIILDGNVFIIFISN